MRPRFDLRFRHVVRVKRQDNMFDASALNYSGEITRRVEIWIPRSAATGRVP